MKWETKQPEPRTAKSVMEHGPIRLSVVPSHTLRGQQWLHLCLMTGYHSTATHSDCLQTWPREAIARARQRLDEFEAKLDNDTTATPETEAPY